MRSRSTTPPPDEPQAACLNLKVNDLVVLLPGAGLPLVKKRQVARIAIIRADYAITSYGRVLTAKDASLVKKHEAQPASPAYFSGTARAMDQALQRGVEIPLPGEEYPEE